jgi:O-antigen biosynthesis protein WbqP
MMNHNHLTRVLDVFLSMAGIIIFFPLLVFVLIIIEILYGKSIFIQQRVGFKQKSFRIFKIRTMKSSTKDQSSHFIKPNDLMPYGKILRVTKLDELPQLVNILFGQMSFVGPRPCLPRQKSVIKEREKRGVFNARPGLTGFSQIRKVDMSHPRKLARLDKLLIKKLNLTIYLGLIVATILGKGLGDRIKR